MQLYWEQLGPPHVVLASHSQPNGPQMPPFMQPSSRQFRLPGVHSGPKAPWLQHTRGESVLRATVSTVPAGHGSDVAHTRLSIGVHGDTSYWLASGSHAVHSLHWPHVPAK